ncbi:MAG: SAVED domain-containing protein [Mesorhizobium sp.]|uniref:SAVED domain-containing protein n=1 Tax=Mesorhizobium sp. TaxID=1871066 RepID=UPI000FE7630C|nr:SAVED domain-containing protein [Mesorhizobium sp.]RWP43842.1 MAG: SAVED domain-containing protein [Mesorhizobium sp.]
MKQIFHHFARSLIDWLFRPKSAGIMAMRVGLALVAIAFGIGWAFDLSIPLQGGRLNVSLDSGEGIPGLVVYAVAAAGLLLALGGLTLECVRYTHDHRSQTRKRVLVIEGRGLRDGPGQPLSDAVPRTLKGHRQSILLDLRQKVEDGKIVAPSQILPRIAGLGAQIDQLTAGVDRSDVNLVYGGLTAVPFTFLTGVIMDDEDKVLVLDWDRRQENWRLLDEEDDGRRFSTTGLDQLVSSPEVVLAVSVSYPIIASDLREGFPTLPVVRITLDEGTLHSHWSDRKQAQLADQFVRTAIELGGKGVARIHLVLAAPNSIVFRFGRSYDKRNLPEIAVYQFEKGSHPPYPWAVAMPVSGISSATISPPPIPA